jgi:hypothetical protein
MIVWTLAACGIIARLMLAARGGVAVASRSAA